MRLTWRRGRARLWRWLAASGATAVALAAVAARSAAQDVVVPTGQGLAGASARVADDVLNRTIALQLDDVTLRRALVAVSELARVTFSYSSAIVPASMRVSLVVDKISVRDALHVLLQGTGLEAVVTAPNLVVLQAVAGRETERTVARTPAASGAIAGTVVDSITGANVPYVVLRVEESGQSVTASAQGRYTIPDVPPGAYHVTAKRVGFVARTKAVTVTEGQVATLNFALSQPPTKLDEVVTTAVGDQRRYEVGNDIATINVDSIAPTVPATNLTDVITSRAPGVQVVETGGLAGSGNAIRIRGQSSMLLQSDPIIIVDGVRQDNTPGGTTGQIFYTGAPSPNRLNDIDFSQVETINILKGPSASTEYGTDAANGVIVITTKRGTSGKTQWHASAEEDGSGVPVGFPEYYYTWGHLTDGSRTPVQCPVLPIEGGQEASLGPPYNTASSYGTCAVDSVTHFNPLNDPRTTLFSTGTRNKYDLSVGGGTDALRFYFAGGLSSEIGTVRLPLVFRPQAAALGIPSSELKPNGLDQRSIRATTSFRLGSTAELTVTTAYMSTYSNMPAAGLTGIAQAYVVLDDSAHQYGYSSSSPGGRNGSPIYRLGQNQHQQTDRVTGGATVDWRPLSWLTAHATVGIDHGAQNKEERLLQQAEAFVAGDPTANGAVAQTQTSTDIYSADVRASAAAAPWSWLRLTTSFGLQLADTRVAGLSAFANTTKDQPTLNGGMVSSVAQLGDRHATLGGYVEEGFNLFNSLFWSLALRLDAGSGFGQAIHDAAYPKFDLSYPIIKNGPTTLRVRTALGAAGRQPNNGANRQLYDLTQQGFLTGGNVPTGLLIGPGNPNLKPERSMEYEGGADVGLWDSRVTIGLTGYWKSTKDALIDQALGFDLGFLPYEENIGDIRNNGIEASINAMAIQTRAVSWSITASIATNHSKLLRVDSGFTQSVISTQRQVVGYPLYGYWGNRYHYVDANHDGILQPDELAFDRTPSFIGSSLPTESGALSTHLGFRRGMITVGAQFSYAGGYRVLDASARRSDFFLSSLTMNAPHAPLADRVRALAMNVDGGYPAAYFEDGTFVRFRELSLTYTLPSGWARALRAQSLTLTGAVRNLALWTRFQGADPEASDQGSQGIGSNHTINNDVRNNGDAAVPLSRYWFVRVNVDW